VNGTCTTAGPGGPTAQGVERTGGGAKRFLHDRLRLAAAFVRRDFLQAASYRIAFLWQGASLLFYVGILFFLSRMLGRGGEGGYFAFAVVGFAVAEGMWGCLTSFSAQVRYDQVVGTLEAMAATRTGLGTVVICSGVYPLLFYGFRMLAVLAVGAVVGAGYGVWDLLRATPVLLLALGAFSGLGIISASMTLVIKKGDPVAAFLGASSFLLGGALYPVHVLPEWLQGVAAALPVTHAVEAARNVLLDGAGYSDVWFELAVLAGFTLGFGLLSVAALRWAVRVVRDRGVRSY